MDYDVIIVGSGPAGLAAATHLCNHGRTVSIIANNCRHGSAIDVLCPDTKEELQFLGLGREAISALGRVCHAIKASWGSTTPLIKSFFGHPYGDSLVVERRMLDMILLRHSINTGATLTAATFQGATRDGLEWRVTYHNVTGVHVSRGRVLVDATGRSASVARTLGTVPTRSDRLIGISGIIPQPSPSILQVIATPEGWWYSLPSGTNETFACLVTDADVARNLNASSTIEWTRLARQVLPEQTRSAPATLEVRACHSAVLENMGEYWLAVGDAAASYDPLSGIGVLHAVRSGRHAASAIAQLLNGNTRAPRQYAAEEFHTFSTYISDRARQFALETRFPDHLFWKRRNMRITHKTASPGAPL